MYTYSLKTDTWFR